MSKLLISEIYKPKTLEETKLPARIQNLIKTNVEKIGVVPKYRLRMLLYGTAGTGKTTTATIVAKNHNLEYLYLSGSNNFNTDTMNKKVYPFCSSFATITGKQKVLIIDEFERIRPAIQDMFKILLDQVPVHTIIITNHVDDIIPEIHSRMDKIDYNFNGGEYNEQVQNYGMLMARIIKEQGIGADGAGLEQLVKVSFPDFRKGTRLLQQFKDTKQSVTVENMGFLIEQGTSDTELYESLRIISDKDFYTKISEYKGRELQVFQALGNPYFIWLNNQGLYTKTLKSAVVVGEWGNKLGQSPNKFVALLACLNQLRDILLK